MTTRFTLCQTHGALSFINLTSKHTREKRTFAVYPIVKILLVLLLFGTAYSDTMAQCDTFYNADATNPLKHMFPYNVDISRLAFGDLDNDGDLDAYILVNVDPSILYLNEGSAKHPLLERSSLPVPNINQGAIFTTVTDIGFADLNGDGKKDLLESEFTESHQHTPPFTAMRYFENTGSLQAPAFTEQNNPLPAAITDSLAYSTAIGVFTFYDVDKDGDLDFTYRNVSGAIELYKNTGCQTAPHFTYYATLLTSAVGNKPQYWDWNGDGLPDLFMGSQLYLNVGTLAAPSFIAASVSPVFTDGTPFVITDVNSDGSPEAYTSDGHLSTIAPIPVVDTTVQKIGNRSMVKYYSEQTAPGYNYNWTYNSKPIPDYHKPFIYAEKKGAYSLEITNACGTGVSLPHFTNNTDMPPVVSADSRMMIPSLQTLGVAITAFPNPFRNQIEVRLPPAVVASTIRITDLAGRTVETVQTGSTLLTVGNRLPTGVYFLQVWQGTIRIYQTKIVKQ